MLASCETAVTVSRVDWLLTEVRRAGAVVLRRAGTNASEGADVDAGATVPWRVTCLERVAEYIRAAAILSVAVWLICGAVLVMYALPPKAGLRVGGVLGFGGVFLCLGFLWI